MLRAVHGEIEAQRVWDVGWLIIILLVSCRHIAFKPVVSLFGVTHGFVLDANGALHVWMDGRPLLAAVERALVRNKLLLCSCVCGVLRFAKSVTQVG